MVGIDDVSMSVLHRSVAMGMAMRLRPLPSFVIVRMMLVVEVQVLMRKSVMAMFPLGGIIRWPQNQRQHDRPSAPQSENGERNR